MFGHGSSIDELREDAKAIPWEDPKKFMADTFAGFILMPIIGLRRAFSVRDWTPETATPAQIFTIACEFGVGYATLLTHLSAGVNMLSRGRAAALRRVTLKALRMDILGALTPEPLRPVWPPPRRLPFLTQPALPHLPGRRRAALDGGAGRRCPARALLPYLWKVNSYGELERLRPANTGVGAGITHHSYIALASFSIANFLSGASGKDPCLMPGGEPGREHFKLFYRICAEVYLGTLDACMAQPQRYLANVAGGLQSMDGARMPQDMGRYAIAYHGRHFLPNGSDM